MIVKPTQNQAIRFSYGDAYRQPTQAETYLNLSVPSPISPGIAVQLRGHDDLLPEKIRTLDVGWLVQPDFGEFEVVAYYNRVEDLIIRTDFTRTDTAVFDPEVGGYVVAVADNINNLENVYHALGLELSARLYPVDGIDVGASYVLQRIVDNSEKVQRETPAHKVSLWGQLRTELGLDVGLSFHFTSREVWQEPNTANVREDFVVDPSLVIMGRVGYRMFDDKLEVSVSGMNIGDFGNHRHREHPFANRVEARFLGSVAARF